MAGREMQRDFPSAGAHDSWGTWPEVRLEKELGGRSWRGLHAHLRNVTSTLQALKWPERF